MLGLRMRDLAVVLAFVVAPSTSEAQSGFVPCWPQAKILACQSAEGRRILLEAAAPISAAAASAEGHLVFVSGGKLWQRALGSPEATQIGVVARVAGKTLGTLLGLTFDPKGVKLTFVDGEAGFDGATADRTVPLANGLHASARPRLPTGPTVSLTGRYKIVHRPLRLCGDDIDSVGVQEGAAPARFDWVDSKTICKEYFYRADGDCNGACGLSETRWLVGDTLLVTYGGGVDAGWSYDFLWRPGTRKEKLDWTVLSPDGRQVITNLGWTTPEGDWLPAPGATALASLWVPAAMLSDSVGAPSPIAPALTTPADPRAAACTDATVCPSHYGVLFPHLAKACAGTFGSGDLDQLKEQVNSGALPPSELAWLSNAYGAKWGYAFTRLPQLNVFFYGAESDRWLPPSCVKARKTLSSFKGLGKQDQSMMEAIKALR